MTRPRIDDPVRFLQDNGILFEINRQVLHPLGLEIHFETDEEASSACIVLEDNRDVPEPLCFSPESYEEGRDKYQEYMAEHGRRNIQKRRQIGMVIQTGPNLPRHIHPEDAEG